MQVFTRRPQYVFFKVKMQPYCIKEEWNQILWFPIDQLLYSTDSDA